MNCRVIGFWITPEHDFDKVVKLMRYNGIKVDDAGSANSVKGRLVSLWIDEGLLEKELTNFDQHIGKFID